MIIPSINNLILRVENVKEQPHSELESIGHPKFDIWIKDYDVEHSNEKIVFDALDDAIKIASEIKVGCKFIHIAIEGGDGNGFLINPSMLKSMAKADCFLEIYADCSTEED